MPDRGNADVPTRLLRHLDALGASLAGRGNAIALIGLGSIGVDLARLDDHSDLDFFVIVDDGAKARYLASIDWLEAVAPVAFSFPNTVDGRKVLFEDGTFAEYAVFTLAELRTAPFLPGRLVWRRDDAPAGLELPTSSPPDPTHSSPEFQVNEALTNLFVGLHREARGERLSAMRLIQVHAVDRAITLLELRNTDRGPIQDPFAIERGIELRFDDDVLPLAVFVLGYERNREAAAAILAWLEVNAQVDPVLATAVRELLVNKAS
jgi:hypothetical protein